MTRGLHINMMGSEVSPHKMAATNIAIFQGNKADKIPLYWKDNYN